MLCPGCLCSDSHMAEKRPYTCTCLASGCSLHHLLAPHSEWQRGVTGKQGGAKLIDSGITTDRLQSNEHTHSWLRLHDRGMRHQVQWCCASRMDTVSGLASIAPALHWFANLASRPVSQRSCFPRLLAWSLAGPPQLMCSQSHPHREFASQVL
jgi:hypothetical protein